MAGKGTGMDDRQQDAPPPGWQLDADGIRVTHWKYGTFFLHRETEPDAPMGDDQQAEQAKQKRAGTATMGGSGWGWTG